MCVSYSGILCKFSLLPFVIALSTLIQTRSVEVPFLAMLLAWDGNADHSIALDPSIQWIGNELLQPFLFLTR